MSSGRRRIAAAVLAVAVAAAGLALVATGHASHHEAAAVATTLSPTTSTAAPATTVPPPPLPSTVAPHAVGTTRLTVVDDRRGTGPRGSRPAVGSRTLPLTVRYPTTGQPGAVDHDGAPPAGTWPLVVFAHGFDASLATYARLLHDLAAAGFVVAAPEFPQSSSTLPGAPVEGDEGEQAHDVAFVIDRLTDATTAPTLAAAIRPGPVGVVGHSDGAQTALLAAFSPAYVDHRIGAVVAASGALDSYGGPWFTTADPPLLSLHGGADELNPLARDQQLVAADPGPAALVLVTGASHLGAVMGPAEPEVARLVADDLAWRLEGSPGGAAAVAVEASSGALRTVASHGG